MSLGKLIFTDLGYASAVCTFVAQKMKFLVSLLLTLNISLRIWSHLLKKFLVENFIFQEVFVKIMAESFALKSL